MIAGVFKAATETDENCYQENFNELSRPYKLCNVPSRVLVALPVHKDQTIHSWVSFKLEFNGATEYGGLDCYKSMTPVSRFWKANVLPDVAKIMGTAEGDWEEPCMQCFKEDEAFDMKHWREFKSEGCSYMDYASN